MDQPFRYRAQGRTWINGVFLAVGFGMLGVYLWTVDGFDLIVVPILGFTAMMAWLVLRNPKAGLEIDDRTLVWWKTSDRTQIPLDAIDRVEIRHWTDSTDVTVHLKTGERLEPPDLSRPRPNRLEMQLKKRGVRVEVS